MVIKAVAGVLHFILALGLLLCVYPWKTYAAFDFPKQVTLFSYLLAAAIVTAISTGASLLTHGFRSGLTRCAACISVACFAVAAVCIGFGPYGLNIPGTRLNGIFFSEWNFVVFFFYVGLPLAMVAAVGNLLLARWLGKSRQP